MPRKGTIFDIQRCSLHDGPGIRTTVFLKGCPLRCLWCHNPESQSFQPQLSYHAERCTDCFACVEICTEGAHLIADGKHVMNHDACKACGQCVPECVYEALSLWGCSQEVRDILEEVEKDRAFFESSGGGLTVSGGEPMAQFGFVHELMSAAKARGIHTCMETCGFAGQEQYKAMIPVTDVFLFDYKETDPDQHRRLTGVANDQILSNLEFLYRNGAAIILRCPMVPGVNDSCEHLAGIARLVQRYPKLAGVELMAYHDMGKDKEARIGREPSPLAGLRTSDEETKTRWLNQLEKLGAERVRIG